jgi:hypothetical protein
VPVNTVPATSPATESLPTESGPAVGRRVARRRRARRAVLIAAVFALGGLTACGGGSDSGSDTASSTKGSGLSISGDDSATTATSAASAEQAKTPTTVASKTSTTVAAKSSAGSADVGGDLTAAFNAVAKGDCSRAKTIADRIDSTDASAASLTALADAMKKAAAEGPSEIRPDLKVFADAMGKLVAVYAKYNLDDPSKIADIANDPTKVAELQAAAAAMDDPAVQKASDKIEAWISARCPGLGGTTR